MIIMEYKKIQYYYSKSYFWIWKYFSKHPIRNVFYFYNLD